MINLLIKLFKLKTKILFGIDLNDFFSLLLYTNSYFATISRWKFPLSMHLQKFFFRLILCFSTQDISPKKHTQRSSIYERNFRKRTFMSTIYTKYMSKRITSFHKCWKEKEEMVEKEILPSKIFRKWSAQASPECHLDCNREKNKNFAMRSRKVLWIIQFI